MITTEPTPWRGFRAIDKLLFVLLPLAAVAIVVLPLLDQVFLRRLARLTGNAGLVSWLASGGTLIVGAGVLLLLALYVLWRRQTLVGNKALWFSSGCPACGERELVRVSRHFGDRFYNLAAVPAYRYACRNCTWRGLRIARREQSREREAELEAALLRFQPDGEALLLSPDADEPQRAQIAVTPVTGSGSMFRDPGDVALLDPPRVRARFDEDDLPDDDPPDDDPVADSNHETEAEAEPIQEMESLWPSPPEV